MDINFYTLAADICRDIVRARAHHRSDAECWHAEMWALSPGQRKVVFELITGDAAPEGEMALYHMCARLAAPRSIHSGPILAHALYVRDLEDRAGIECDAKARGNARTILKALTWTDGTEKIEDMLQEVWRRD